MPVRVRKLIGTVLIIILVIVYALAATTFASRLLGTSPWWVHLAYFFFTGLLWISARHADHQVDGKSP